MISNAKVFMVLVALVFVLVHVFFTCSPYLNYGTNIATIGTDSYILTDLTPYPCDGSIDSVLCAFKGSRTAAQVCDRDSTCLGYFVNVDGHNQLFKNVPTTSIPVPSTHNISPTPILFNMKRVSGLKLKPFVA